VSKAKLKVRSEASRRAPNIAQNQIAKRSESENFFAKNCEAKIFFVCAKRSEANNFSKLRKIAKNCEIAKKFLTRKKSSIILF
jgi:hypothetical protein